MLGYRGPLLLTLLGLSLPVYSAPAHELADRATVRPSPVGSSAVHPSPATGSTAQSPMMLKACPAQPPAYIDPNPSLKKKLLAISPPLAIGSKVASLSGGTPHVTSKVAPLPQKTPLRGSNTKVGVRGVPASAKASRVLQGPPAQHSALGSIKQTSALPSASGSLKRASALPSSSKSVSGTATSARPSTSASFNESLTVPCQYYDLPKVTPLPKPATSCPLGSKSIDKTGVKTTGDKAGVKTDTRKTLTPRQPGNTFQAYSVANDGSMVCTPRQVLRIGSTLVGEGTMARVYTVSGNANFVVKEFFMPRGRELQVWEAARAEVYWALRVGQLYRVNDFLFSRTPVTPLIVQRKLPGVPLWRTRWFRNLQAHRTSMSRNDHNLLVARISFTVTSYVMNYGVLHDDITSGNVLCDPNRDSPHEVPHPTALIDWGDAEEAFQVDGHSRSMRAVVALVQREVIACVDDLAEKLEFLTDSSGSED